MDDFIGDWSSLPGYGPSVGVPMTVEFPRVCCVCQFELKAGDRVIGEQIGVNPWQWRHRGCQQPNTPTKEAS